MSRSRVGAGVFEGIDAPDRTGLQCLRARLVVGCAGTRCVVLTDVACRGLICLVGRVIGWV